MPSHDYLTRLISHMGWADRLVIETLRAAGDTAPDALELYGHILGAEHVWQSRLVGSTPKIEVWPKLTLEECEQVARENLDRLSQYVSALGPTDPIRGITYRNSAGVEFTSTAEDILLQVCLHGSYHRGQVAWIARNAGVAPRPTDYIAFIRGAPTATRADRR